jgi:hypothetical protein
LREAPLYGVAERVRVPTSGKFYAAGLVTRLINVAPLPVERQRPLVLAQPYVDRVAQEVVSRPGQVRDFGDKLRLDPMDTGKEAQKPTEFSSNRPYSHRSGVCPTGTALGNNPWAPHRLLLMRRTDYSLT